MLDARWQLGIIPVQDVWIWNTVTHPDSVALRVYYSQKYCVNSILPFLINRNFVHDGIDPRMVFLRKQTQFDYVYRIIVGMSAAFLESLKKGIIIQCHE